MANRIYLSNKRVTVGAFIQSIARLSQLPFQSERKPGILGRQHRITHKHLFQVAIFLFAIAAKATQAIPTHKHQMK